MSRGFFGDSFDFDHDGELDTFERAMDFMAFDEVMSEDEEDEDDELEAASLDYEELSYMSSRERCEALEDAGLEPDDYDFDE